MSEPQDGVFDREAWLASHSRTITQASWDERAPAHATSPGYNVAGLLADPTALSDVVAFDRPRLGSVAGQRGVHLKCHIGTDTLSLSRLGARMSGLDYSASAITAAAELARTAGADIDYHEADVYDAVAVLGANEFDLVYTGIGALCWLPSIDRWAGVVAGLLRPGGRLFLREGHPVLWSLADPDERAQLVIEHAYFERPEPTVWTEGGTYVPTDAEFSCNETHEWNHGLGQVVTALLDHGMVITQLVEHDTVPWDPLPGMTEPVGGGEYRLVDRPYRLPMSYTLQAVLG